MHSELLSLHAFSSGHSSSTESCKSPACLLLQALGPQQASSSRMVRQVSEPAEPPVERAVVPKAGSKRGRKPTASAEANARPVKQRRTASGRAATALAAAEPPDAAQDATQDAAQDADAACEATTLTQTEASVQPGRSKRKGKSAPAKQGSGRQAQSKVRAPQATLILYKWCSSCHC